MAFEVVIIEALGSAVPVWNSALAPEAVSVRAEPGVVGATFIRNVVASVIELTVALFARPEPVNAIPTTSPTVLSQVTVVLGLALVVQFVNTTPAAVRERPEPVPVAFVVSTNVVGPVIEFTFAPAGMFVPVTIIPGHRFVVLAQLTRALLIVVAQDERLIGLVLLDVPTA